MQRSLQRHRQSPPNAAHGSIYSRRAPRGVLASICRRRHRSPRFISGLCLMQPAPPPPLKNQRRRPCANPSSNAKLRLLPSIGSERVVFHGTQNPNVLPGRSHDMLLGQPGSHICRDRLLLRRPLAPVIAPKPQADHLIARLCGLGVGEKGSLAGNRCRLVPLGPPPAFGCLPLQFADGRRSARRRYVCRSEPPGCPPVATSLILSSA